MKIDKNVLKNILFKVFKVFLSFFIYIFLYFLFMFIIFMITYPNILIEQAKYINEYKEILLFIYIMGCIFGFGIDIYILIEKKIFELMKIISMKIKTKKNSF